jgi:hypothetical protein
MEMNSSKGNKAIDEAISAVTNQIVNEIVPKLHPKSILFTGSFGRNEPAAIVNDGNLKFLSDCEICIVPDKYISKKSIERVKSKLSKITGLDLTISRSIGLRIYSSLPVPQVISCKIWKHTIQRYDLKYGSRIIYGENCLQKTPDFKPEDIPLWEGIRLMFNRIAEALKHFSIDSSYTLEEKQELIYWISKIIIACQDALLLSIGKYHPSYRIRNNMFQELFPQYFNELNKELPKFLPLTLKATNYKLNPEKDIYNKSVTELWFDTVEICDKVFKYMIEKDMSITFDSYCEFQDKYLKHPKIRNEYYNELFSSSIYRNTMTLFRSYKFLSLKVIKRFKTPWKHITYSIIPLVYFSLSRNGYTDGLQLKQARNTMLTFKKLEQTSKDPSEEWRYLKEQLFNLWYIICY